MSRITLTNSAIEPSTPEADYMTIYGMGDHVLLKDSTGASRALDTTGVSYVTTAYVGGTTLAVSNPPVDAGAQMTWAVVDAYTTIAEIRKVTAVGSGSVTLASGLSFTHSAGATVLFVDRPVINVKWFGAKGDGVTDDSAALQAAFNHRNSSIGLQWNTEIVLPEGNYLINTGLNLCNRQNIYARGLGGGPLYSGVVITAKCANEAAIEMIGGKSITLENITIIGDAVSTPSVGVWTGRSSISTDTAAIYFRGVRIAGSFTKAIYLNTGSESNHFDFCSLYTDSATCPAGVLMDYRNAVYGLTPQYATLFTSYDGVICRMFNSSVICSSGATSFVPFYVYAGSAPNIYNTYTRSYGQPIFYLRGGQSTPSWTVDNLLVEGAPSYLIKCTEDATHNVTNKYVYAQFRNIPTNGAKYSSQAIWFDDNMILLSSSFINTSLYGDVRLYIATDCVFDRWAVYGAGGSFALTFTVTNYTYRCRIQVNADDTLNIATARQTIVENNSPTLDDGTFELRNMALKVGLNGDANAPRITRILSASGTWNPASLADGEGASTSVTLTGARADGNWVAMASFSSITAVGWNITASPATDVVRVNIVNKTGGPVDLPEGTVRVVAMKVA